MKKTFLFGFISLVCSPAFGQWTSNGSTISTVQNVGIGTTAPAYSLDVNGNTRSANFVLPLSGQIGYALSDKFTYKERVIGHYALGWIADSWSSQGGSLWQSGFGGIKFFTTGQFRMGINDSGNVGIGTEAPTQKLDVNGNIKAKNLVFSSGSQISMNLSDNLTYQGYSIGHYALTWMPDPWFSGSNTLWQSGHGGIKFFTFGQFRMGINSSGNVGIGTDNPKNKLEVAGTIRATEVKIEALPWADFVFDKDYKLLSLEEVKAHIDEYKHLPDVPSEKQVIEEGINIGEMQAKLLQKIEELTLYVIQQDIKNKELEKEIKELKVSLSKE
ncbi:hypothetical protein CLV62_12319 [Dysgonomonas alginatilytica]|uniref:Uncharacterized protein n=1 Tax=Dysgonomonas alginatilytica TaxID=1605892 RepID=A0A2V3PML7_9BACT|nr:hypothetical protein [Dysgonomonas alginatilytica]PXV61976.1 hypothetical protein CLV62_12319 [Dysgonomonas alginatilytica]